MSSAEGVVLPKPAIPKTLGILNVIFAVLLILFGLCIGVGALLTPALTQFGQKQIEQVKVQAAAQKASDLKTLDDRAKAATTDEEKATIAKERDEVEKRETPALHDLSQSTAILKDPRVMGFTVAQVLTGLILHVALLVAGIGLIRLTPWGRTLGLWWAGLQIAQILILGIVNFTVILPITQANNAAMMAELNKPAANGAPNPQAAMAQVNELGNKLAPVFLGLQVLAGVTYPIVCLVLLRTAGARAACVGSKPRADAIPEF